MTSPTLKYEPRRWQTTAIAKWVEAGLRGIVEVVTGGGKTVFAEMCIVEAMERFSDLRVVIVVPSTSLMDQWFISLQEELGLGEADLATWSGRSKPKTPALVNIMVINTARRHAEQVASAGPTMLVVDECHRAGSESNAKALRGSYVAALGLSATPEREFDDAFSTILVPALGGVIYKYDLNAAKADGVVSDFDLINIRVDLGDDEQEMYDRLTARIVRTSRSASGDEEAESRLEVLLRRRARVSAMARLRVPVAARVLDLHRGSRTMVFHEDIGEAARLVDLLKTRGHSVTIYHSGISTAVRRDNLRLYRKGIFDVMVSCRALDEGINIPETQVAVIASATASHRQRVQRLGRVLRPAKGKERAIVYSLYATDIEEKRLAMEATKLTSASSIAWRKVRVNRG